MKFCKKKLLLLKFFALALTLSLHAQAFKEINFEKALNTHKLMQLYDSKTHRFKHTLSEFKSVSSLTKRLYFLNKKLKNLRNLKKDIVIKAFKNQNNKLNIWQKIKNIDNKLQKYSEEKEKIIDSIAVGGHTESKTIMPIICKILNDIIKKNRTNNIILLNNLPNYYHAPTNLKTNYFHRFIYNGNKDELLKYTEKIPYFSSIFKNINQAIIYNKTKN